MIVRLKSKNASMKTFIELNLQTHPSNRFFCFSLLFFALSVFRCEDEKPKTELEKLPPATQEGKDTFGCLVNGKAWVPKSPLDAGPDFWRDWIYITANLHVGGQKQQIWFDIFDPEQGLKTYELSAELERRVTFYNRATSCDYKTISGKLTVTSLNAKSFSGTFEFTAISSICKDTLRVTHGRFDF